MDAPGNLTAWLEIAGGERVPVRGTCSVGRSRSNTLVLAGEKISRRHALVHAQGENEFWLVDFGSANGSFVNGRRVTQPIPLRDGDQLLIAHIPVTFRLEAGAVPAGFSPTTQVTVREIRTEPCWLLVADIESSTRLSQTCPADQLPVLIGGWFSRCKQIIDDNEGQINKFLGDGFFAYWIGQEEVVDKVAGAIREFRQVQEAAEPRFRIVLHCGPVSIGGSTSLGEESLLGKEVNFVFRMEKLAGALGVSWLFSEPASGQINPLESTREMGSYEVSGFEGTFPFFTLPA